MLLLQTAQPQHVGGGHGLPSPYSVPAGKVVLAKIELLSFENLQESWDMNEVQVRAASSTWSSSPAFPFTAAFLSFCLSLCLSLPCGCVQLKDKCCLPACLPACLPPPRRRRPPHRAAGAGSPSTQCQLRRRH
eukprot:SAG22_NODE_74_length_22289_cov_65.265119_1_plen_132_part_10